MSIPMNPTPGERPGTHHAPEPVVLPAPDGVNIAPIIVGATVLVLAATALVWQFGDGDPGKWQLGPMVPAVLGGFLLLIALSGLVIRLVRRDSRRG